MRIIQAVILGSLLLCAICPIRAQSPSVDTKPPSAPSAETLDPTNVLAGILQTAIGLPQPSSAVDKGKNIALVGVDSDLNILWFAVRPDNVTTAVPITDNETVPKLMLQDKYRSLTLGDIGKEEDRYKALVDKYNDLLAKYRRLALLAMAQSVKDIAPAPPPISHCTSTSFIPGVVDTTCN